MLPRNTEEKNDTSKGGSSNKKTSEQKALSEEVNGDIYNILQSMFVEFSCFIQTEVNDLKQSIQFMTDKFDTFCAEMGKIKEELKEIKKDNNSLKEENDVLRFRLNEIEQYSRRENVMIYGIPVTKSESLYEVINTISKVTGAENFGQDVSVAHRLPSQKGKVQTIIVRFCKRSSDSWLKCFKEESRKHSDGFGIPLQKLSQHFQPGDHLTPTTRSLFNKTREVAREKGYKFIWIKDCKILIKKDENSSVSRIIHYNDLDNL
ncbi:hypothetical protein ANN_15384 [Periplaneta americana]|uniref:FP protein C-terminal domain-containing protein n=1 Tax=Periplaneta americana TaxID=6978 RepID=A0ABQ8SHD4_PERAM|nr:hypothetical protein ANN_15384 [Periplaneta americana]